MNQNNFTWWVQVLESILHFRLAPSVIATFVNEIYDKNTNDIQYLLSKFSYYLHGTTCYQLWIGWNMFTEDHYSISLNIRFIIWLRNLVIISPYHFIDRTLEIAFHYIISMYNVQCSFFIWWGIWMVTFKIFILTHLF